MSLDVQSVYGLAGLARTQADKEVDTYKPGQRVVAHVYLTDGSGQPAHKLNKVPALVAAVFEPPHQLARKHSADRQEDGKFLGKDFSNPAKHADSAPVQRMIAVLTVLNGSVVPAVLKESAVKGGDITHEAGAAESVYANIERQVLSEIRHHPHVLADQVLTGLKGTPLTPNNRFSKLRGTQDRVDTIFDALTQLAASDPEITSDHFLNARSAFKLGISASPQAIKPLPDARYSDKNGAPLELSRQAVSALLKDMPMDSPQRKLLEIAAQSLEQAEKDNRQKGPVLEARVPKPRIFPQPGV